MSDRETIFTSIRKALDPLPERTAYPDWDTELSVSNHARSGADTVSLFAARLKAAKGTLLDGWPALAAWLREAGLTHGYVDPALRAEAEAALQEFSLEDRIDRDRIDEYAFGITVASSAIAESGTLILRDADSPYRLAALAPWVHVAVVRRDSIVRTVAEAVTSMDNDPSIIFATGPSKTADIEGILIEGVHGPGVQVCLLV
jgi:L-lactate dehydrogenase complex protein LldG